MNSVECCNIQHTKKLASDAETFGNFTVLSKSFPSTRLEVSDFELTFTARTAFTL